MSGLTYGQRHRPGELLSGMWNLEDARAAIAKIEPVAKRHGYLVSLYGSVLRNGYGRDIDLILVPWRPPSDALTVVQALALAVDGDLAEAAHAHYANACIIATAAGPIDVQVRPHPPIA